MNYFWPESINTHWGPGPVNTNSGPGPGNGKYKYPVSERYPLAVHTQCGNICYFFWERVNQRWSTSNAITEMINDIGF